MCQLITIFHLSVLYVSVVFTKITVLDETQFSNPKSFDYHFDDDMKAFADTNDIYDELVPYLPRFVIYKNGRDAGYTRIPIVTRKMPTWSTPSRRIKIEPTWTTPPPRAIFLNTRRRSKSWKPTTTVQKLKKVILVTTRQSQRRSTTKQPKRITTTQTPWVIFTTLQPKKFSSSQWPRTTTIKQTAKKFLFTTRSKFFTTRRRSRTWTMRKISTASQRLRFSISTQQPRKKYMSTLQTTTQRIATTRTYHHRFTVAYNRSTSRRFKWIRTTLSPRKFISFKWTPRTISQSQSVANPRFNLTGQKFFHKEFMPFQFSATSKQPPISQTIMQSFQEKSRRDQTIFSQSAKKDSNQALNNKFDHPKTVARSVNSLILSKPLLIHPHTGPTFNCKILQPGKDGRPSSQHNDTCAQNVPGFSADGKCRCTYEIDGRDDNGCAKAFIYTCIPK